MEISPPIYCCRVPRGKAGKKKLGGDVYMRTKTKRRKNTENFNNQSINPINKQTNKQTKG